jgi:hypothetical protein
MDKIRYEILEDGTLSVETEGISGKNHMSADEASIQNALGGKTKITLKVGHAMAHVHHHDHVHGGEEHHHH